MAPVNPRIIWNVLHENMRSASNQSIHSHHIPIHVATKRHYSQKVTKNLITHAIGLTVLIQWKMRSGKSA